MKSRRQPPKEEGMKWGQRLHFTEYELLIALNADQSIECSDHVPLIRTMLTAVVAEADKRGLLVPDEMRLDLPVHNPDEFRVFNQQWPKSWYATMLRVQSEHQEVVGSVVRRSPSLIACLVAMADERGIPVPDEVREHLVEPLRHLADDGTGWEG